MSDILFLVFQLVILIFSVMVHEIAHGYAAERLGDPTARLAGRLTLNPLRHLDLFGSILFPLFLFIVRSPVILGWAKPVPYNPHNLVKDLRGGPLKVALAGPFSNLFILLVFGLLARGGLGFVNPVAVTLFGLIAYLNASLAVLNLMPIPPLDGSKILPLILPPRYAFALERAGMSGILLVILFLLFFSGALSALISALFLSVAGGDVIALMNEVLRSLGF